MDMVLDTALLDMVTDHMDTQLMAMEITERDLLMLSQRLMLTTDTVLDTALLDMVTEHMDTTERDLLMLSQRLMLTMVSMDMPDLIPMDILPHMPMVLMEVTGDKINATQLR